MTLSGVQLTAAGLFIYVNNYYKGCDEDGGIFVAYGNGYEEIETVDEGHIVKIFTEAHHQGCLAGFEHRRLEQYLQEVEGQIDNILAMTGQKL